MASQSNISTSIGDALPRVFIADPSAVVIDRLAALVDDVAHVAGRATNARDAINGIRHDSPHLVVLDVSMDKGIDLLGEIKNHQPKLIAVVLTHSTEETTRRICLRLGAEYFLDKIREFERVREIVVSIGGEWNRPLST